MDDREFETRKLALREAIVTFSNSGGDEVDGMDDDETILSAAAKYFNFLMDIPQPTREAPTNPEPDGDE